MHEKRNLLFCYFKEHAPISFVFILFTGIFALVFSLYDLETEAVFYAFGLCLFLGAILFSIHFHFYRKRHQKCMEIIKNIPLLPDELPAPKMLAESDYQNMIKTYKQILDTDINSRKNENREILDYYTTWVHQIKTPISVMKMTLDEEDTKEHRKLLAELFRIEQYVEMALNYLRLGSDFSDYVFREYDLDVIIKQAIHKYAHQFISRKIRLNYTPCSVKVLTDEKWLLFIIEQILSNSIKYTQKGSVTITVSSDKILKIADTGIGIAPEDLPRIFQKGYTGYNGRLDKKSTGLGLYLCQTAAKRLSHKLCASSTPGKGTEISIDLRTDKHEKKTI